MTFFTEEVKQKILDKMEHAPLTNSKCESKMAETDESKV